MTYIEVSILLLCDHDCDSFFSGEPCCCSCLLELLLADWHGPVPVTMAKELLELTGEPW